MIAVVIISRTRGRTPTRWFRSTLPLGERLRQVYSSGMEISNIYRERGAFTASAICHRVLFVSVERVVMAFPSCNSVGFPAGGSSLTHDTKSARIKFARAFKAARRLFSGLPRFQACKQSSRGVGQAFQVFCSFLTACASHMQFVMERFPNERKSTARDGNLTARERNYAC